jgi:hypothetical protein
MTPETREQILKSRDEIVKIMREMREYLANPDRDESVALARWMRGVETRLELLEKGFR